MASDHEVVPDREQTHRRLVAAARTPADVADHRRRRAGRARRTQGPRVGHSPVEPADSVHDGRGLGPHAEQEHRGDSGKRHYRRADQPDERSPHHDLLTIGGPRTP